MKKVLGLVVAAMFLFSASGWTYANGSNALNSQKSNLSVVSLANKSAPKAKMAKKKAAKKAVKKPIIHKSTTITTKKTHKKGNTTTTTTTTKTTKHK